MDVIFTKVDNGASNHGVPYIHAMVGGVRVRFLSRKDEDFMGWRCEQDGDGGCIHSDAAEDFLGRRIRDRIEHLEISRRAS